MVSSQCKVIYEFENNLCKVKIPLVKRVKNVKNCDIYIGEYDFILFVDKVLARFTLSRKFDLKNIKNVQLAFNSILKHYTVDLPCLAEEPKAGSNTNTIETNTENAVSGKKNVQFEESVLKLKRLTDTSTLNLDGHNCNFESKFGYGFAGRFTMDTYPIQYKLEPICRLVNPHNISPFGRSIRREADELNDFCQDQYKIHFVDLQVPEGQEDPLKYSFNFDDCQLTEEEDNILHNLSLAKLEVCLDDEQTEIDCTLISILLAICYDIRSTLNEPTCESGWTRSILSPALVYFETFSSLKTVVECFLRRSLIYPLYRNYGFSRMCVEDAVKALQKGKQWLVKQFLVTADQFLQSADSRQFLNDYFIADYIRYLNNIVDNDHLHMLSRNLKNILYDVTKHDLRLGLGEIENEVISELFGDMHMVISTGAEYDDGDDGDDDDYESSEGMSGDNDDDHNNETDTNSAENIESIENDDDIYGEDDDDSTSDDEDNISVIENVSKNSIC